MKDTMKRITKDNRLIAELRTDLSAATLRRQKLTAKSIVNELTNVIHEKLKSGARLEDIHSFVNERLGVEQKMTLGTFKKYWRASKKTAGLSTARSTRLTQRGAVTTVVRPQTIQGAVGKNDAIKSKETSTDFREDRDDI